MSYFFVFLIYLTIGLSVFFYNKSDVFGKEMIKTQRIVNVVIPLRGREYWGEFANARAIIDLLVQKKISSTVLIQYSILDDQEALNYLKNLPEFIELGAFLEVDTHWADSYKVSYIFGQFDRANANQILLSGYYPAERKRLLDGYMVKFNEVFGRFPQSAGAWYLDAFSLNYLSDKYRIKALVDVADQFDTDTYGVWGKPWSVPFISSRFNPLIPGAGTNDSSRPVTIQWAPRDPSKAFGRGAFYSTFSVQANDYLGKGLDTRYFEHLAEIYLSQANGLNQLTIGLEAGQEGYAFLTEFTRQLQNLESRPVSFTTMADFADIYRGGGNSQYLKKTVSGTDFKLSDNYGRFYQSPFYRAYLVKSGERLELKDIRQYEEENLFSDWFTADKGRLLSRIVPSCREVEEEGIELIHNPDFKEKEILADGEKIYAADNPLWEKNLLTGYFFKILTDYLLKIRADLTSDFRYSRIEGQFYLGITLWPDKILALSTRFPYLDVHKFPFQVLSKFKKIPILPDISLFASSFQREKINCKIKI